MKTQKLTTLTVLLTSLAFVACGKGFDASGVNELNFEEPPIVFGKAFNPLVASYGVSQAEYTLEDLFHKRNGLVFDTITLSLAEPIDPSDEDLFSLSIVLVDYSAPSSNPISIKEVRVEGSQILPFVKTPMPSLLGSEGVDATVVKEAPVLDATTESKSASHVDTDSGVSEDNGIKYPALQKQSLHIGSIDIDTNLLAEAASSLNFTAVEEGRKAVFAIEVSFNKITQNKVEIESTEEAPTDRDEPTLDVAPYIESEAIETATPLMVFALNPADILSENLKLVGADSRQELPTLKAKRIDINNLDAMILSTKLFIKAPIPALLKPADSSSIVSLRGSVERLAVQADINAAKVNEEIGMINHLSDRGSAEMFNIFNTTKDTRLKELANKAVASASSAMEFSRNFDMHKVYDLLELVQGANQAVNESEEMTFQQVQKHYYDAQGPAVEIKNLLSQVSEQLNKVRSAQRLVKIHESQLLTQSLSRL